MAFLEQEETLPQNPLFVLDGLYCEEEHVEEDLGEGNLKEPLGFLEDDEDYDDEIVSLMAKEKVIHCLYSDGFLMAARRGAVQWMLRVIGHYGFTAMTTALAINYFDRFITSPFFQRDKPWMSQLAAVACLSLAAKVEETQVPLLLDLQVEESKYVFEAKTIQRMELLVLSALEWKMHPVTPLSFVDQIVRKLRLGANLNLRLLWRCERLLLSVFTDSRFLSFLPSVLATAIMLHVIKEVDSCNVLDCQNELIDVLKTSRDRVDECCKLLLELPGNHGQMHCPPHKRECQSIPGSPSGVIDAYLSCHSSNDSWVFLCSSEPPLKKSRTHDQHMGLAPISQMSVGLVSSP
ncbi:cyclin-D3-3-like [Diospyros lotus]|uniref:cyclin-D3-3-like n=1 Tax=Diospyros lotus TaxID=55363 RepID=UPI002257D3B6|nr:cyclin-D3-3-like [Diospyros lotus]